MANNKKENTTDAEVTNEEVTNEEESSTESNNIPGMNDMVEVFLQKERGINAKKELNININGKDFHIELGKNVKIPYYVYLAILARENDRDFEDDFIRLNNRTDL